MVKTNRERTDTVIPIICKPVPEAIFKATVKRIAAEQRILRIAGKNPKYISSREADEILGTEVLLVNQNAGQMTLFEK